MTRGSVANPTARGSQRAVFLSYASEDTDAAQRVCATVRAAGVEVWFDQSEPASGWRRLGRHDPQADQVLRPAYPGHLRQRPCPDRGILSARVEAGGRSVTPDRSGHPAVARVKFEDAPCPSGVITWNCY